MILTVLHPSRVVVTEGIPGATAKVMQRGSEVTLPQEFLATTLKHWLPADSLRTTEAEVWLVGYPEATQLQFWLNPLKLFTLILQPLAYST